MSLFEKLFHLRKKPSTAVERPTNNISDFIDRSQNGTAYCRIKISQIGRLYSGLVTRLLDNGMPANELGSMLEANLLGVCPKCGTCLMGKGIVQVGKKQGRKDAGGSKGSRRILSGECVNQKCACHEIVVCWRMKEDNRVAGLSHRKAAKALGLVEVGTKGD